MQVTEETSVQDIGEEISILNELGLSIPQAKIFLALSTKQAMTVQEISHISHEARPFVYQVLPQLEEVGLVLEIIDKPERFSAISLEECISILMQRRIIKTAELKKRIGVLAHKVRLMQQEEFNEETQFALIPKRDAIYAQAKKMLQKVQERMDFLCLTRRMIAWLSDCLPIFEEALTRKVDCRVIMPQPEQKTGIWKSLKNLNKYKTFELRLIPKEPKFGFSIWDKKEILMTTSPVNSPTPAKTLWSNNKGLVDLCQEHFCCIWKKAERTNLKS
jgi:sugar-specific transcriptional regulator TrmB